MRVAILAKNSYGDLVAIDRAMNRLTDQDELYLDAVPKMLADEIVANIAYLRSMNVSYVPRPTKIADAVLIIYEDGQSELHQYPKEYYDVSLIQEEVLV